MHSTGTSRFRFLRVLVDEAAIVRVMNIPRMITERLTGPGNVRKYSEINRHLPLAVRYPVIVVHEVPRRGDSGSITGPR